MNKKDTMQIKEMITEALKEEREKYLFPAFEEVRSSFSSLRKEMLEGFHMIGLKMDIMNNRIDAGMEACMLAAENTSQLRDHEARITALELHSGSRKPSKD